MIKEEEKLIHEEQILKEKLAQINLTYRKIMENIEYFINEQLKNQNKNLDDKIVKKIIIMMRQMRIFINRLLHQDNQQILILNLLPIILI